MYQIRDYRADDKVNALAVKENVENFFISAGYSSEKLLSNWSRWGLLPTCGSKMSGQISILRHQTLLVNNSVRKFDDVTNDAECKERLIDENINQAAHLQKDFQKTSIT